MKPLCKEVTWLWIHVADEQKNALDYYWLKHDQYIVLETASVHQSEDSWFDGLAFEDLVKHVVKDEHMAVHAVE